MDFKFNFGEMTYYEREKLYNYIIEYDPNIILECGSGKGASTYIMLNAIKKDGKIYSCDPKRTPDFKSELLNFEKVKSEVLIDELIKSNIIPDFIFFDGPEEPNVALDDFKKLEKKVKVGTIFSMHDWCTNKRKYDNGVSKKSILLKPYIKSSKKWKLIEETNGENYKEGEETVGMCFYKKIR